MADPDIDWETCIEDGCVGIRLPSGGKCWAHANTADLDAALQQLGNDGWLGARRASHATVLGRLLAAPNDDQGHRVLTDARFDRASFQDTAEFDEVPFLRTARFARPSFHSAARFEQPSFRGDAVFTGAHFHGDAEFYQARFHSHANFSMVTFHGDANFDRATFESEVEFIGTRFRGDADFAGATFRGHARFDQATFQRARQVGPMLVRKTLDLDDAVFHKRAKIHKYVDISLYRPSAIFDHARV